MVKILVFGGSLRKESFNKKLAKNAMWGAEEGGAECTFINLEDYPLPLFSEDLESEIGKDPNQVKLKDLMHSHDAMIISTPEYNSGIPGALKNVIDWCSRKFEGESSLDCFSMKPVLLLSASPGSGGGMRAMPHVRYVLENVHMVVYPYQYALRSAGDKFKEDDSLIDEERDKVKKMGKDFAEFASKLN